MTSHQGQNREPWHLTRDRCHGPCSVCYSAQPVQVMSTNDHYLTDRLTVSYLGVLSQLGQVVRIWHQTQLFLQERYHRAVSWLRHSRSVLDSTLQHHSPSSPQHTLHTLTGSHHLTNKNWPKNVSLLMSQHEEWLELTKTTLQPSNNRTKIRNWPRSCIWVKGSDCLNNLTRTVSHFYCLLNSLQSYPGLHTWAPIETPMATPTKDINGTIWCFTHIHERGQFLIFVVLFDGWSVVFVNSSHVS